MLHMRLNPRLVPRMQVPYLLHASWLCCAGDGQRAREERAQHPAKEPRRCNAGSHVLVGGRLRICLRHQRRRRHRVSVRGWQ